MIIYIFVRDEIFIAAHSDKTKAITQAGNHAQKRIDEGEAIQVHEHSFTPSEVKPDTKVRVGGTESNPILADAPECLACEIYAREVSVGGKRVRYSVKQIPLI